VSPRVNVEKDLPFSFRDRQPPAFHAHAEMVEGPSCLVKEPTSGLHWAPRRRSILPRVRSRELPPLALRSKFDVRCARLVPPSCLETQK
jgi:hypothetical protein